LNGGLWANFKVQEITTFYIKTNSTNVSLIFRVNGAHIAEGICTSSVCFIQHLFV
jgi:hypothetical protein